MSRENATFYTKSLLGGGVKSKATECENEFRYKVERLRYKTTETLRFSFSFFQNCSHKYSRQILCQLGKKMTFETSPGSRFLSDLFVNDLLRHFSVKLL